MLYFVIYTSSFLLYLTQVSAANMPHTTSVIAQSTGFSETLIIIPLISANVNTDIYFKNSTLLLMVENTLNK